VSGEVTQVNTSLTEKPESVNKDPHNAWMIAVKVADPAKRPISRLRARGANE
jgi:glycine cleavage system H lipoate-binding protein